MKTSAFLERILDFSARLLVVVIALVSVWHWRTDGFAQRAQVSSSLIVPGSGGGHAYTFNADLVLGSRGDRLSRWIFPVDHADAPQSSRLKLFHHDGREFGSPHSLHSDIAGKGGGRYSDWIGWVTFSMPDNSDPRVGAPILVSRSAPLLRIVGPLLALTLLVMSLRFVMRSARPMAEVALIRRGFVDMRAQFGRSANREFTARLCEHGVRICLGFALLVGFAHSRTDGFADRAAVSAPAFSAWSGGGHAYVFDLDAILPRESAMSRWLYPFDSGDDFDASHLELFDANGKPLGPAHSLHEEIARKGQGRFSDWVGGVVFSMPDNSDPRRGGALTVKRSAPLFLVTEPFLALAILLGLVRSLVPTSRPVREFEWIAALWRRVRFGMTA